MLKVYEVSGSGSYAIYHAIVVANSEEEALFMVSHDDADEDWDVEDAWSPWVYMARELDTLSTTETEPKVIASKGYYE